MRAPVRVACFVLALACGASESVGAQSAKPAAPDAALTGAPLRKPIRHDTLQTRIAQSDVAIHRFAIPLAHARLAYVDLRYETPLIEALGEHDLVLNGGYWGYRGTRRVLEGLLIVNDQLLSPAHPRGGVLEIRGGAARVVRGEEFKPAADTALALQCSPRLVDAGKLIPKLEANKRAARTALCVTRDRTQLQAYLTDAAITLPELAKFLLSEGCIEALNLDGGPSTAAVARAAQANVMIGRGLELPYGIGFRVR